MIFLMVPETSNQQRLRLFALRLVSSLAQTRAQALDDAGQNNTPQRRAAAKLHNHTRRLLEAEA